MTAGPAGQAAAAPHWQQHGAAEPGEGDEHEAQHVRQPVAPVRRQVAREVVEAGDVLVVDQIAHAVRLHDVVEEELVHAVEGLEPRPAAPRDWRHHALARPRCTIFIRKHTYTII